MRTGCHSYTDTHEYPCRYQYTIAHVDALGDSRVQYGSVGDVYAD
jgi:hypothetical protein